MRPARFAALVLAAAALVAGPVAGANWMLDPFGWFGRSTAGFYFESERDIKRGLVSHREAEGLLMGSSKVAEWQPSQIRGHRVLNAAWSAAVPEEIEAFLEDVGPRVDFIALGLDLFMFNEGTYPLVTRSPFSTWQPQLISTHLLSVEMLQRGLWARARRLAGERPRILPDGARNTAADEAEDRLKPRSDAAVLERLQRSVFGNFTYASTRVDRLRGVRAWSERRCVTLVVFLNPMSRPVLDLIDEIGVAGELARFRQDVQSVFPGVVDLVDGELSAPDNYWRADPDHYYPSIGTRIFDEHVAPRLRPAEDGDACRPSGLERWVPIGSRAGRAARRRRPAPVPAAPAARSSGRRRCPCRRRSRTPRTGSPRRSGTRA